MENFKKYCFSSFTVLAIFISLFISAALILLLCSWQTLAYKPLFLQNNNHPSTAPNNSSNVKKDDLQIALEKASMADKTLIVAFVNEAYVEPDENEYPSMLDLFLEGFWAGEGTRPLVGHLLVVSMDQAAYEKCEFRRLNCYRLVGEGAAGGADFAGEKVYMSDGFIEMMWRRTRFLLTVLNRGFSFIFTDTDVLWLRNPFTRLSINTTFDFHISTDRFNGNLSSNKNPINTGFYFVRSNNKTISLFQTWYDTRKNSTGLKEQDVLARLVRAGVLGKLGIRVEFLDTLYFSGFCHDSRDVGLVATVHANCCRSILAKVRDLKMVLRDWKWFKSGKNFSDDGSKNRTNSFRWSSHTSCANSWHMT